MAGGTEPFSISKLFAAIAAPKEMESSASTAAASGELNRRPLCSGYSLCGAGGGGFAAVILDRGGKRQQLEQVIQDLNATGLDISEERNSFSLHDVQVDTRGIVVGFV